MQAIREHGSIEMSGGLAYACRMAKGPFRKSFLREWRDYRGYTLEELAQLAGMTAGNISHLENQKQGYTQFALEALGKALNVEPGFILLVNPEADDPTEDLLKATKTLKVAKK